MKQPKKRKRGGQPKPARERKRNNLTIRIMDDLRAALLRASRASGRSLSEEAAWRMTLSFLLEAEIEDLFQAREGTDDAIMRILARRGWEQQWDLEKGILRGPSNQDEQHYTGPVFIPPRQHRLPKGETSGAREG